MKDFQEKLKKTESLDEVRNLEKGTEIFLMINSLQDNLNFFIGGKLDHLAGKHLVFQNPPKSYNIAIKFDSDSPNILNCLRRIRDSSQTNSRQGYTLTEDYEIYYVGK